MFSLIFSSSAYTLNLVKDYGGYTFLNLVSLLSVFQCSSVLNLLHLRGLTTPYHYGSYKFSGISHQGKNDPGHLEPLFWLVN